MSVVVFVLFFLQEMTKKINVTGRSSSQHMSKRLTCEHCDYCTNSTTNFRRHAKRQHDVLDLNVKRWKHYEQLLVFPRKTGFVPLD